MCRDCDIARLERTIEHLEHDIQAYRGALGYPIHCNHDGRLMDGTFPKNGIAEALNKQISDGTTNSLDILPSRL